MKSLKHIRRYSVKTDMTSLNVSILLENRESRGLDHCKNITIITDVIIWMATCPHKNSSQKTTVRQNAIRRIKKDIGISRMTHELFVDSISVPSSNEPYLFAKFSFYQFFKL